MGYSKPKYPLNDHCSIIHDGTLYVYSSAGFQSLKLEEGAEWKAMPMDISLTGATCVDAAGAGKMYVVGGAVNETAAKWNYPGLMHYSFAQKKWDWQRSQSWTTQNRHSHGAVYLEQSKKLLIYSGSQRTGDVGPSSETFLISTEEPFNVQSMPSAGAPPSVKPMLMAMDKDSALLVGGGAANTAIWKFSEASGWQDMGVALQQPIVNQEAVQCTVISGKGKSKVLEKFDMSVIPNKVDRILLLKEDGTPAAVGATPGKAKRVTVDDWPTYNATYAPTSARSGYSLAQGEDGLTVASGGNQTDPIVLFNAKENSWVNATALFAGQQIISNSKTTSTISSTTLPTSTPVFSSVPSSTSAADITAPPATAPSNKGKMLTVLGATLGTIFGIAAILIMILLCLKYRKNKSKQNQGYVEKDRMSFADRGADFMKEAGGSVVTQHYNVGNDSTTSLAIIQGRGVNGHKKNMASDASQAGLVKKTSPLGYSDPVELSKFDLKPEPVPERMVRQNSGRTPAVAKANPRARSSGWSRYFANNEATNLASQPDRSTYASDRTSTASQSNYTNSRMYGQRPSQQIAPLEIPKFDGQRLSRVASGSPTLGSSTVTLPHQVQPMQAELGRANSSGSSRSGVSHNDEYIRQAAENWTPVGNDNRASSTYTGSMVFDTNGNKHDGTSSYYPDATDSFYPKSNFSSFYPGQGDSPRILDMRDSTHTMFPSANAPSAPVEDMPKSKFSSMYPSPPPLGLPQDRDSTVTVFPGPNASRAGLNEPLPNHHPSSFYPPPRVGHESTVTMFPGPGGAPDKSKNGQSDMSWLNLGSSR